MESVRDSRECAQQQQLAELLLVTMCIDSSSDTTASRKATLHKGIDALITSCDISHCGYEPTNFVAVLSLAAVHEDTLCKMQLIDGLEALLAALGLTAFEEYMLKSAKERPFETWCDWKSAVHNPQDTLDEIQDTSLRCTGQSLIEKPLRRSKRLAAIQSAANRVHAI